MTRSASRVAPTITVSAIFVAITTPAFYQTVKPHKNNEMTDVVAECI